MIRHAVKHATLPMISYFGMASGFGQILGEALNEDKGARGRVMVGPDRPIHDRLRYE